MKNYILSLFWLLSTIFVYADQYKIEDMNGDSVRYMGKSLTKGDVFEYKDSLIWQNSTALHIVNMRTGNRERIREEDFYAEQNVSLWSYLIKVSHGSSRVCDDYNLRKLMGNVIPLKDTLRIRIDNPDVIYIYWGNNKQVSLPEYYISYWFNGQFYKEHAPLEGDEIVITKQLFKHVPFNQSVSITLSSIDKDGNIQIISDSTVIIMS